MVGERRHAGRRRLDHPYHLTAPSPAQAASPPPTWTPTATSTCLARAYPRRRRHLVGDRRHARRRRLDHPHHLTDSSTGPYGVAAADLDGDGDFDVLGARGLADDITWWQNKGGQFTLPTTGTAPASMNAGATGRLPEDRLHPQRPHRRQRRGAGDASTLRFEDTTGTPDPLTTAEANAIIARPQGLRRRQRQRHLRRWHRHARHDRRHAVAGRQRRPDRHLHRRRRQRPASSATGTRTYFVVLNLTPTYRYDPARNGVTKIRVTHITEATQHRRGRGERLAAAHGVHREHPEQRRRYRWTSRRQQSRRQPLLRRLLRVRRRLPLRRLQRAHRLPPRRPRRRPPPRPPPRPTPTTTPTVTPTATPTTTPTSRRRPPPRQPYVHADRHRPAARRHQSRFARPGASRHRPDLQHLAQQQDRRNPSQRELVGPAAHV